MALFTLPRFTLAARAFGIRIWRVERRENDRVEELEFECPRCASAVFAAFYGPCESCSADLRAQFAGRARDVAAAEYEPKMNVTPNAVALKD